MVIFLDNQKNIFTGSSTNNFDNFDNLKVIKKINFRANIPNDDIAKGETIVPYLQPFPPKGIGYQRYIFILYKQNKKLNFDSHKINEM